MKRGERRPINSVDGLVSNRRPSSDESKSRTILYDDYLGIGTPPEPEIEKQVIAFEIKVPKVKLPELPYKKIGYYCAGGLTTVAIVVGSFVGIKHLTKKPTDKGSKQLTPDFKVVTPLDKPDLGKVQGATSTYDPDKHVLSYTDSFFGADFTVSQQPLPDNLKNNPDAISNIASNLGSKASLETQQGTVYIATNPKTKQQTAVFATPKILLFIRSSSPVDDTVWQDYINKLDTQ